MPLRELNLPGERSRSQELYAQLREAIVSGELRSGERLIETNIARLAGVSRTPVREALQRLEIDGLVRESDRGVEVCGFTLDEMADLCAVRETLEGMAASLAAGARTAMDLAVMRNLAEQHEQAVHDSADMKVQVRLNHSLHETIWQASRNRYLASELRSLRAVIHTLQDTTLRLVERQVESIAEHRALIDAIEARDAVEAERLARRHFQKAMAARLMMVGAPRADGLEEAVRSSGAGI